MAAPVLFACGLLVAIGVLLLLTRMGGSADGERLEIRFEAPCLSGGISVGELIAARADAIGLGEPVLTSAGGDLLLTATMPGAKDDATTIPALLARTGALSIHRPGDPSALITTDRVTRVSLEFDDSGMPLTRVKLDLEGIEAFEAAAKADSAGSLEIRIDGQTAAVRPNGVPLEDNAVDVITGDGPTAERMKRAVDRSIILRHGPLPCTVRVRSVQPVAGADAGR